MLTAKEKKIKEVENSLDDKKTTTPREFLKEQMEDIRHHSHAYSARDRDISQHMYELMIECGLEDDDQVVWVSEDNHENEQGPAIAWGDECLIAFDEGRRIGRCVWSARGSMYSVHIVMED